MKVTDWDYDFLIIGSGFGGSVSALRLSEKGYRVAVIERGKRFHASDFPVTNWNIRKYLWWPLFRCFGIQNLTFFKNVFILSGSGVGGGSLVYANTLMIPSDPFFQSGSWAGLRDWKNELDPFYQTAKKMLGATDNPKVTRADKILKSIADEMNRGHTYSTSTVGVYFGAPGIPKSDPYFSGKGPDRSGCVFCGGCMVGCRHGAKNTLDKNYLYLAEQNGVKVYPETSVIRIHSSSSAGTYPNTRADSDGGYIVETESSTALFFRKPTQRKTFRAKKVIFSAGVLGTLRLLMRAKYVDKTLPNISDQLGRNVRTNSEALIGVYDPQALGAPEDHSVGVAISSVFHPDDFTHIEPVRYSRGSSFMRILAVPMVDGAFCWIRPLLFLVSMATRPLKMLRLFFNSKWAESSIILLVMQNLDNRLRFGLRRTFWNGFQKDLATSEEPTSPKVPSFIEVGHRAARRFAEKVGGEAQSAVNEVMLSVPTTAHILGGCPIGSSSQTGVINEAHEVFGYPGLFVCDGSAIPANLGVNPSLTITAMTERAMSLIPSKT